MTFTIFRDPLWNSIRADAMAVALVDTPEFQRLRYVRQLGLAHLVYPGATHSRFEHALGAYHLASRALALLEERGELGDTVPTDEPAVVRAAALLHDIGHYPFSHALEEIGVPHHEHIASTLLVAGTIGDLLRDSLAPDAPERVIALIGGRSASPLQRLVSGSLDLDKIEYLKRDALMCGVPYGEIDVDRLIDALVVVEDPVTGAPSIGVREKGLSALESLLFAKYQMYRNVYWHHAVRSATAMYKRLVDDALRVGALDVQSLAGFTDEGLLHHLESRAPGPLVLALRARRLYKRALESPAVAFGEDEASWIARDWTLTVAVENALAVEVGLLPGDLLLDYPAKEQMLGLDLPVVRRSGEVGRLTAAGLPGAIDLPRLSAELYRSARWLRVFAPSGVSLPAERVLRALRRPDDELRDRIARGLALLA